MRLSNLFDDPEVRGVVESAQIKAHERLSELTPRQREVALLMAEGLPNKIIAFRMGISPRSVENHRVEVMRKTESKTFASLMRLVFLAG